MSKKTNEAKRKAAMKKPRRNTHARKGRRPNPMHGKSVPNSPFGLMGDPIFMHYALGAIFRYMEITIPNFPEAAGPYLSSGEVDAEFVEPEGVSGTVNPDPPEDKKSEQEQN